MLAAIERPTGASEVRELAPAQTRALRQAVLRPHETVAQMAAEEPPGAVAFGAFSHGELVAVGLIAPDGPAHSWRVRGMASAEHARRRGAGAAVLDALLGYARARGATRVWCNARLGAVGFYERAGFRVVSEVFEIARVGPHVVMERDFPLEG